MSNLHKLFKELQKLDYEDFDLLCDAYREYQNVKINCKNMGIKYSDKYLVNSTKVRVASNATCGTLVPTAVSNGRTRDKKVQDIILGDNLDIIEEAAIKKGLI